MIIMKRWLALMLTISMAFSDCGSVGAIAAETDTAALASDNNENTVPGETPADNAPVLEGGMDNIEGISEDGTETDNIEDISGDESETLKSVDIDALSKGADDDYADDNVDDINDEEINFMQEEVAYSGTETELPALHIGWINKGEDLPALDDSAFEYDVPVYFEGSDSVILFVDCSDMGEMLENKGEEDEDSEGESEDNGEDEGDKEDVDNEETSKNVQGTLVWSILRGDNETVEGSTCLVDEEDDWIDFETVEESPYFKMEENEDEESSIYKTATLTAIIVEDNNNDETKDNENTESDTDYNYYIRAAYYFLEDGELYTNQDFYAATTIAFIPEADTNTDETPEDKEDGEGKDPDEDPDGEESGTEKNPDDEQTDDEKPEGDDEGNPSEGEDDSETDESTIELVLDIDSDTTYPDGKVTIHSDERVTMYTGATVRVNATAVTEDEDVDIPEISWESSNEDIATVKESHTDAGSAQITAKSSGMAQITARCGDVTAVVRVEVMEVLKDLSSSSNYMSIDGFKRESEDFVYTGSAITQELKVYHNDILLKEKTDYTLTYKNNVNAAAYNSAKAPSVTIKLKGQYSGSVTLYYTISPLDINDISECSSLGYEQALAYSKNLKIPAPALTFGKKKLTANKDFVCDYTTLPTDYKKGDSYTAGEEYNYTVNGIGNFTGSFQMQLVVIKDKNLNFSSSTVTLEKKQYEYHGEALGKTEVKIGQVKLNKNVLDSSLYDYEICTNGIDGTYVMVYPTDAGRAAGYRGCKKVNLKLVGDRNIGDAALGENWKDSITFSQETLNEKGGIFQEQTGVLTFGTGTDKETLMEGEDYTVKYSNAKKAGTVTVTFTGKGRYKGSLKKKYVIAPDISSLKLTFGNVIYEDDTPVSIAYQKGGAVPDVILKDQNDNVLKNKTDYTVKLTDNKTPGTTMSCVITGKGNYKGYEKTVQLKVTNGDISKATISVQDKPYNTKQDAWKSKVTITDVNGKKLTAGTDYVKEPSYEYEGMENSQAPTEGVVVKVTVTGMGAYEGSTIIGKYRIYENSISKLKITIDAQEYTGNEIKLSKSDIHVYASSADAKKKEELKDDCYEIVESGYKNNVKAGTAKVTLHGIGEYGGTKTYSFKIQKKTYLTNGVKGITLDQTSFVMSIQEQEKRTLVAQITQVDASNKLFNSTVIWSTSNSNIATVENGTNDGTNATGIIIAKKEGSVTITATTQDGNKKAQCKIKIINAPILKEAGQIIEKEEGQTYRLEFENDGSQEVNMSGLEWESSNPEVVYVDSSGLLTMKKIGVVVITLYASKRSYVQQCYVIVKGEEDMPPEGNYVIFEKREGSVDDTDDIRSAIEKANDRKWDGVYIPAGVYHIDAVKSIYMKNNLSLIMSPGAMLIAIGNSSEIYDIIWVYQLENVTISGGTIIGERNEHGSTKGEWGNGIGVYDCTNVTISNVDISQCWGDGIYLGASDDSDVNATNTNVTITDCNVHDNRRNNLSITAADYVTINNCKFNYAKGTDPQFGIDIETNNRNNPCEHIKIYNTEIKGNAKGCMGIITVANDILLENCTLSGAFYNMAGTNVVFRNTTINGTVVGDVKYE